MVPDEGTRDSDSVPDDVEVFVLTGATACGKSAVGLMLAQRMDAEIISLDSMKVYRRMDIGTAKPGPEDRARVRHHLINIREPWEGYTVHEFVNDAEAAARDAIARGKRVIFEGGTPLYLKAFLDGLFEGPEPDPAVRARLEEEALVSGLAHLHGRLAAVDPEAGERIHPNDRRRIVRALEVYEQTGVPISEHQKQFGRRRRHIKAKLAALHRPKEIMGERIRRRVDAMIEAGWVDEARALVDSGRPLSKQASGALGYEELWAHIRGELTLEDAAQKICAQTWRFMRRQLTWLRSFGDLMWVDGAADAALGAERVAHLWSR
jgi:tRNA dimethylallyltransferase